MSSHHHHHHHEESSKNIGLAFFMNFFFMLFEIVTGLISGSIAIISDSFHDLGDSFSLGVSWILEKKKNNPANEKYAYGYKRLSVVGAIINIFVLIVAIAVSLYHAVLRLFNPEPIKTGVVIIVAIVGSIINFIPIIKMRTSKTISEKAVSLHLLEDVMTWCALLVVSIIQHFTKWYFLDSCFAIVICLVLLIGVIRSCISIYHIIMDAKPSDVNIQELIESIKECNTNIKTVKDIKVRDIDGETYSADIQIELDCDYDITNLDSLYKAINEAVEQYEIYLITIQIFVLKD